jgi:hypothetical protein
MTQTKPPQGDSTNTMHFGISPQIAYFVSEGISVGGQLNFDYVKPKDVDALTSFGIGPIVGYNLWLTPGQLSLWPQVGFFYNQRKESITVGTTSITGTHTTMAIGLYVPLLIHPVKHFHFGIGPYVNLDISSKDKADAGGDAVDGAKNTVFGLKAEIAGWL